MATHKGIVVH